MTLSPTEILSGVRVDEGRCLHTLQGTLSFDPSTAPDQGFFPRVLTRPASPAAIDLIGGSAVTRTALMRCLAASETSLATEGFRDVEAWAAATIHAGTIVLVAADYQADTVAIGRDIRTILAIAPAARIVVLAEIGSQSVLIELLKQGVKGVVPCEATIDNVIFATRLVRRGGLFTPLLETSRSQPVARQESEREPPLTPRQVEIIRELRKGSSNKDIARDLRMSELTVRVHMRNIMRRLKVHSRTEIVARTNQAERPAHAAS